MPSRKFGSLVPLLGALAVAASPALAVSVSVTTNADSGAGSFREAVAMANVDSSVDSIVFDADLGTIVLTTASGSVEYTNTQALMIMGSGNTVTGDGGAFDLLRSTGGGDLWIAHLAFEDSGENGVVVAVPEMSGDLQTTLYKVRIERSAGFGLLIGEIDSPGSDANLMIDVFYSTVTDNGTPCPACGEGSGDPRDDTDGVRVNERDEGSIYFHLHKSLFAENLYDGVELDELGEGDVIGDLTHSGFDRNGAGNGDDLEDGFDIDEDDAGSIRINAIHSSFSSNDDEGFDIDEAGDGDIMAMLNMSEAIANEDEGVKLSEEDGGDVRFHASNSIVDDSTSQDGVELEETGTGDLEATFVRGEATGNDNYGVKATQEDAGTGWIRFQGTLLSPNGDGDVDVEGVTIRKKR